MSLNPTGPNEDFQTAQVRLYAESIYNGTLDKLVEAIANTLGLQDDKAVDGTPIKMEFDYAYSKLIEAGYVLTHKYIESGGTCTLEIKIYKQERTITHDVKTTFSVSVN